MEEANPKRRKKVAPKEAKRKEMVDIITTLEKLLFDEPDNFGEALLKYSLKDITYMCSISRTIRRGCTMLSSRFWMAVTLGDTRLTDLLDIRVKKLSVMDTYFYEKYKHEWQWKDLYRERTREAVYAADILQRRMKELDHALFLFLFIDDGKGDDISTYPLERATLGFSGVEVGASALMNTNTMIHEGMVMMAPHKEMWLQGITVTNANMNMMSSKGPNYTARVVVAASDKIPGEKPEYHVILDSKKFVFTGSETVENVGNVVTYRKEGLQVQMRVIRARKALNKLKVDVCLQLMDLKWLRIIDYILNHEFRSWIYNGGPQNDEIETAERSILKSRLDIPAEDRSQSESESESDDSDEEMDVGNRLIYRLGETEPLSSICIVKTKREGLVSLFDARSMKSLCRHRHEMKSLISYLETDRKMNELCPKCKDLKIV